MQIDNSLCWIKNRNKIENYLTTMPRGKNRLDVLKIVKNIDRMVGELSIVEVDARRGNNIYRRDELLLKINESILILEECILMVRLIG